MFQTNRQDIHILRSAADLSWNWRNLRCSANPILVADNVLPNVTRDFLRCAGEIAAGNFILNGGALNDLANGRTPQDFDGHCLTRHHPLRAMDYIEIWSRRQGYKILHYDPHIRLAWKRLKIDTPHGEYDISFLKGDMPLRELAQQMADEADVSPCARSATADMAFQSKRCVDGEAQRQIICRPLHTARNRFAHLRRWVKYAIVKYPDRPVIYQCNFDTALFAKLNTLRPQIQVMYEKLSASGQTPHNFEPFRPLIPKLYDRLLAEAHASL